MFLKMVLLLAVLVSSSHVFAKDIKIPSFCGAGNLKRFITGSFEVTGSTGIIAVNIPQMAMSMKQNFRVESAKVAELPKSKTNPTQINPDFLNYMGSLGITDPKNPIDYELSALDQAGQSEPLGMFTDKAQNATVSSSFKVIVMPYGSGKNFLSISFREKGASKPYEFAIATDECN